MTVPAPLGRFDDDHRPSRLPTALVGAVVLGLLIAVPLGQQRRFSIELWLAAAAGWLAWMAVRALVSTAPVGSRPWRGMLALPDRTPTVADRRPSDLVSLEGTVMAAQDSERAFVYRLRPRLRAVVAHQLRVNHGVDLDGPPEPVEQILGPTAWMLDDRIGDRRPTGPELHDLLDRVSSPKGVVHD